MTRQTSDAEILRIRELAVVGKTQRDIAAEVGCSTDIVHYYTRDFLPLREIQLRGVKATPEELDALFLGLKRGTKPRLVRGNSVPAALAKAVLTALALGASEDEVARRAGLYVGQARAIVARFGPTPPIGGPTP